MMSLETNIIFAFTGKVIKTLLSSAKYKFFIKPTVQDIVERININPNMKTIILGVTLPLVNSNIGRSINTM
jgi:hypothetical protein